METESGHEEFILAVKRSWVHTLERDDGQSYDIAHSREYEEYIRLGYKIVKAYSVGDKYDYWLTAADCEIGYHEQRLTALERLAVRCYVGKYWQIPF